MTAKCPLCDGTGYKDHAGFAMDPCKHEAAANHNAPHPSATELLKRWLAVFAVAITMGCSGLLYFVAITKGYPWWLYAIPTSQLATACMVIRNWRDEEDPTKPGPRGEE